MIAEPPFEAGADQETLTLVLPMVPATFVGASGTVAGVTELLATDAELVPTAFVAVTVNVYAIPFVRPVIVIGDDPAEAKCPALDVTV